MVFAPKKFLAFIVLTIALALALAAIETIKLVATVMVITIAVVGAMAMLLALVAFFFWLRMYKAKTDAAATISRTEADQARMVTFALAGQVELILGGRVMMTEYGAMRFENLRRLPEIASDNVLLPAQSIIPVPDFVDIDDVLTGQPSLNRLVLGVSENEEIVTESLKNLTHVAIAGVTRFGKSIFIQQLLYQIMAAEDNVSLYLADLGGTSFIDFGLPYASSIPDVEVMVSKVMAEAERRKDLYEATGQGIRSLDIYNSITGENLPWVVMVIDEALYLMEKSKEVKDQLELAVSWAAKYGISCIIISQDWKSNVVKTSTRNNFSSRFQFYAEDRVQSNILIKGSLAHEIEDKGRCFARLPGQNKVTEMQTPFISKEKIKQLRQKRLTPAQTGVNSPTAPVETATPPLTFVVADEPAEPNEDEARIIDAVETVKTDHGRVILSRVTKMLGLTATGPNNDRIKLVCDKWNISY